MRQNIVLATALIAVIIILLVVPATAQQSTSPTSPILTDESTATPTRICPTFEPTIQATPSRSDWYLYQGEASDINDYCGQTCVAMAIQYVRGIQYAKGTKVPLLRTIVSEVGKNSDEFTVSEDLKPPLDKWQVESKYLTDMDTISQAIQNREHIVIVPLEMTAIPEGADLGDGETDPREHCYKYVDYDLGHWVVAHRITDDGNWVIVYDPYVFDRDIYWYRGKVGELPKGWNRYYPYPEFKSAFDKNGAQALEIIGGSDPAIELSLHKQPEFPVLEPGEETEIYFELQNTGSEVWRTGRYVLVNVNNKPLGARSPMALSVDVPSGQLLGWRFSITGPLVPGVYRTEWEFSYDGRPVGPLIWTDVIVVPPDSDDLAGIIHSMIEEARQEAEEEFEERWEELRRQIIEMIWARMIELICGAPIASMALLFSALWLNQQRSAILSKEH
jgi:hypothetical protein